MKRLSAFLILTALAALPASGQTPVVMQYADVNNLRAATLTHGDFWTDTNSAGVLQNSGVYYPATSAKTIGYAGALWLGGYDEAGQFRGAVQKYRQAGLQDFWPGPIAAGGSISAAESQRWEKICKINAGDITQFLATTPHTVANTPEGILTWPAAGNLYAKGYQAAPLIINESLAPFVDVDTNGLYDPLAGDYPAMKGDQMLWWVFNDNGPTPHTYTGTSPMGMQVAATAYGYQRGNAIDNVLYYQFTITNKSLHTYDSLRAALWTDSDLGYANDDMTAKDTARRAGIFFNGTPTDGFGEPNSYGSNIPAMAIRSLYSTGFESPSFGFFNNDATAFGNPTSGVEYYRLMKGLNRVGDPIPAEWLPQINLDSPSYDICGLPPGDRRMVIGTSLSTLAPGESGRSVFALVAAPDQGGCPDLNFSGLLDVLDTAALVWDNPLAPTGINSINAIAGALRILPNPAHNTATITLPAGAAATDRVLVVDMLGKAAATPARSVAGGWELSLTGLPAGLYTVCVESRAGRFVGKLVKQ